MPERAAGYRCEDEAREALTAAAARLWTASGAPGPATLSLRWRRSGAGGLLATSVSAWEPAPGPDTVLWIMPDEGPADVQGGEVDDAGDGGEGGQGGERRPCSAVPPPDWRLHRDLYRHRADLGAVVSSRPVFSTTLACIAAVRGAGIPEFHPDVAAAAGGAIRCAAQAPPASPALFRNILDALEDRHACLLAGKGLLVTGATLQAALARSTEIESLAQVFYRVLQSGGGAAR